MNTEVSLTSKQHSEIKNHLFPGDGKEAISILLCGRHQHNGNSKLLVHEIIKIPYEKCIERKYDRVSWSTDFLQSVLDKAANNNWGIIKVHSHPQGYERFSTTDDKSDKELFTQIYVWLNDFSKPHASMIMFPDGNLIGREVDPDGNFVSLDAIKIIGEDIHILKKNSKENSDLEFDKKNMQAFGTKTISLLKDLKIAVVGCSGTGSPVIEMLARLGTGKLVLVDFDFVEEKNLNRILNSTQADAMSKIPKVEMFKRTLINMGLGTEVEGFNDDLSNVKTLDALADCDVIFGCVDSIEGRHILNKLSTFYLIPYFDLGVKLISDGKGGIDSIAGNVHYLQPGLSTLIGRGVYTLEELQAESLKKSDPKEYEKRLKSKYIEGVNEDRPAVITINMLCASLAVNEFLARIHPFRIDKNNEFAITKFELVNWSFNYESEEKQNSENIFSKFIGRGDMNPPLNLPSLSIKNEKIIRDLV